MSARVLSSVVDSAECCKKRHIGLTFEHFRCRFLKVVRESSIPTLLSVSFLFDSMNSDFFSVDLSVRRAFVRVARHSREKGDY